MNIGLTFEASRDTWPAQFMESLATLPRHHATIFPQSLGFRVLGLGFRVWGLGSKLALTGN